MGVVGGEVGIGAGDGDRRRGGKVGRIPVGHRIVHGGPVTGAGIPELRRGEDRRGSTQISRGRAQVRSACHYYG